MFLVLIKILFAHKTVINVNLLILFMNKTVTRLIKILINLYINFI